MAEGVSEDNVAALVNEVTRFFITLVGFGDIFLEDYLILLETELFSSSLDTVDEVEVVGREFIVEKNNSELEIRLLAVFAGCKCHTHRCNHNEGKNK
jgi:hypothetical protein